MLKNVLLCFVVPKQATWVGRKKCWRNRLDQIYKDAVKKQGCTTADTIKKNLKVAHRLSRTCSIVLKYLEVKSLVCRNLSSSFSEKRSRTVGVWTTSVKLAFSKG